MCNVCVGCGGGAGEVYEWMSGPSANCAKVRVALSVLGIFNIVCVNASTLII